MAKVNYNHTCKKCKMNCCEFLAVTLLDEEYQLYLKIKPEISNHVTTFGKVHLMMPPCIFFDAKTKECSIYDIRPINCRKYPIMTTSNMESRSPNHPLDCILVTKDLSCHLSNDLSDTDLNDCLFWDIVHNAYVFSKGMEFTKDMGDLDDHLSQLFKTKKLLNPKTQRKILYAFSHAEYRDVFLKPEYSHAMQSYLQSLKDFKDTLI